MRRRSALALPAVLLAACAATGASSTTSAPSSPQRAPDPPARVCRAPTGPREPEVLAIDWADAEKIDLSDAMAKHVAVVRYDCDGVTVLRDCAAPGTYTYGGVSPMRSALRLDDPARLEATLPFATEDLAAAVRRGDVVDLAFIVVGQHATTARDVPRARLEGRCEGATHTVRAVGVGAFALAAGPAGKTNAAAELLGLGPMAKNGAPVERTGGELSACWLSDFAGSSPMPIAKCKALVHVLLSPLRDEPAPPADAAPEDRAEAPPSGRVVERERFETSPVRNACKIGLRAATKDGACVKPDTTSTSFVCDFTDLDECRAQCEKGDAKSCWNVAAHLLDGKLNPVKGDPRPDAFVWLVKSCTHGYARGCGNVGYALRNGVAVAKDVERGTKMLRDACAGGDALSCMVVGNAELWGDGATSDLRASRTHYERACALGNARGCAVAARMAEAGEGGPRDVAAAVRMYERACGERDPKSCKDAKQIAEREASLGGEGAKVVADDRRVEVGVAPWASPCKAALRMEERTSTCVAPSPVRTFVCDASVIDECKRQCDRGSARSCWNAAANLHGVWGRGLKGAREETNAFLDRACKGGFAPACTQLGGALVTGSGIAKDRERGVALIERACAAKDAPGCDWLANQFWLGTNGFAKDRPRAAAIYEKACELGMKTACVNGANALSTETEGVYREPSRALRLLEGACKLTGDDGHCRKAARLRADGATP